VYERPLHPRFFVPRRIPTAGPSGLPGLLRLCCEITKWMRAAAAGVIRRGSSERRVRFGRCCFVLLLVDEEDC